jgi:hypothetical protein
MTSRSSAFWAGFFCVVSALVCGCGGNSNQTTQQTAPSALSYAQPSIAAVVGEAISADTPTVTGTVTAYSVNPALPSGFTLNSTSGTIAGTPSAVTATATYTVTASNAAGSTTAALKIAVAAAAVQPPSGLTYPQTTISATVGQAITADTPTVTGTVTSYEPWAPRWTGNRRNRRNDLRGANGGVSFGCVCSHRFECIGIDNGDDSDRGRCSSAAAGHIPICLRFSARTSRRSDPNRHTKRQLYLYSHHVHGQSGASGWATDE